MLADNAVMTDIPLNTHLQLTQALQQLSQTAPGSTAARQAIEVIVKQLADNIISLHPSDNAQLKAAMLPGGRLQGQLSNNQRYQVQLNTQQGAQLQFFSSGANTSLSTLPLNDSLSQLLLKLPASQLNQLISAALPQLKIGPFAQNTDHFASLPATLVAQNDKQIRLNFTSLNVSLTLNLPLNQALANSLLALPSGEKLTVELSPQGQMWQLTIQKADNSERAAGKSVDQLILSHRAAGESSKTTVNPAGNLNEPLANANDGKQSVRLNISAELAAPVIKSVLSDYAAKQAVELPLTLKTLVKQLVSATPPESQALLSKVLRLVPENISLQIKPSGDAALLIQHPKLVANLPLTAHDIDHLKPLKISGLAPLKADLLNLQGGADPGKAPVASSAPTTLNSDNTLKEPKAQANSSLTSQSQMTLDKQGTSANRHDNQVGESGKTASTALPDIKTLQQLIEKHPANNSAVTTSLLGSKTQQSELVQSLLRIALPKAELASTVLNTLDKIVTDQANLKALFDTNTQDWLKQLSQEIKQSVPQGKEQDAMQIKQLLTTPALALSSVQLVTPPASQGLLSGLITLLQVSLAARLMRNQPSQAERIAQILPGIFNETSSTSGTANPQRAMQDFAQLEQKQQLMREIGKLLAEHQSNKLNNAEKLLQGQDTFYYNLPTAFAGVFKNIELLIKRDETHEQNKQQATPNTQTWQLTLKLSVGELGELLSKAKLRRDELELDFYASNDVVLKQLMNFLPLLKRRLESLGIEVSKSQCQLGKMPETLDQRSYHIFQAKA